MRKPDPHGIRIVAVDGPSGSGKSTLARRLATALGDLSTSHRSVMVVTTDDFLSWSDINGWWPRFQQEVLRPLISGHDAIYQARDWENDEFGTGLREWREVPWRPVVVIEGVTCTRRAAGDQVSSRIWIEAPAQTRLARGVAADGESHRRLWEAWMRDEEAFFTSDATRELADLLVDGAPHVAHDPDTELVTLPAP